MSDVVVREFDLDRIEMHGNPRSTFDPLALEELAATLRDSSGPMQLPVGYVVTDEEGERVRLIFGERRLRAMRLNREIDGSRWRSMWVRVVPKPSEGDFLKWSLAENLQRENLKPSEMGHWLSAMMEQADPMTGQALWSMESLAEEIGKSAQFVRAAIHSVRASDNVRKAMDSGQCSIWVAGLIGTLPVEVQDQAAAEVIFGMGGPMKLEESKTHLTTNFRRDLRQADFDQQDEDLLPDAPACQSCEWWGGNRSDVGGVMRSQWCLNPACFSKKQARAAEIERARIMDEGGDLVVMDPDEGLELFEEHSGRLSPTCGYVDLKSKPDAYFLTDGERNRESMATWGKMLEDDCPTRTVVWDRKGRKRELVETGAAVVAAMGSKYGSLFRPEAGKGFLSAEEKAEQSRVRSAMDREGREVLIEGAREIFGSLEKMNWHRAMVKDLLEMAMEQGLKPDDYRFLSESISGTEGSSEQTHRGLVELIDAQGLDMDGLLALLLLVLQVRRVRYEGFESWVEEGPMESLCEVAGFDPAEWVKKWKKRRQAAERKARLEA